MLYQRNAYSKDIILFCVYVLGRQKLGTILEYGWIAFKLREGLILTAKPCIIETKDSVAAPSAPLAAVVPTKLAKEAPIKSSTVPYIQEEKEILKNINLVSKIKLTKFSSK